MDIIEFRKDLDDMARISKESQGEWDYEGNQDLDPATISPGCNRKVWWICKKGHHYQAWIADRTGHKKTGCPFCSGKRVPRIRCIETGEVFDTKSSAAKTIGVSINTITKCINNYENDAKGFHLEYI